MGSNSSAKNNYMKIPYGKRESLVCGRWKQPPENENVSFAVRNGLKRIVCIQKPSLLWYEFQKLKQAFRIYTEEPYKIYVSSFLVIIFFIGITIWRQSIFYWVFFSGADSENGEADRWGATETQSSRQRDGFHTHCPGEKAFISVVKNCWFWRLRPRRIKNTRHFDS